MRLRLPSAAFLAIGLVLILPAIARAEDGLGDAAELLAQAAERLETAEDAPNGMIAYAKAIRAYEAGLAALRAGLRNVRGERLALEAGLEARRDELARLLTVLLALEGEPPQARLLHPSGPVAAARTGHLVAALVPALRAESGILRAELDRIADLEAVQHGALARLRDSLAGLQRARAGLTGHLSQRQRDDDATATASATAAALRADAASLKDMAGSISRLNAAPVGDLSFEDPDGRLPWPVAGSILRRYGETDAAGIARPGLILEAAPQSLVTSPTRATLRYAGPFLDYGEIAILEPAPGFLLVLAGLGQIMRRQGEIIEAGEPIGVLRGEQRAGDEFLIVQTPASRETRTETLYIEIRKEGEPVDPLPWFATRP